MRSDFSIRRLLGEAEPGPSPVETYQWLSCSRYNPPKLHRSRKGDERTRRKVGKTPRVPFSPGQVQSLEATFRAKPYLTSQEVSMLSSCLSLSESRVKIWFQNRRARERRLKGNQWKNLNINPSKGVNTCNTGGCSAFHPVRPQSSSLKNSVGTLDPLITSFSYIAK